MVVDPKGADYSGYAGATVITPNRKEAELAAGRSLARREELVKAGARLRENLGLDHLLITLGPEGMMLFPAAGTADPPPHPGPGGLRRLRGRGHGGGGHGPGAGPLGRPGAGRHPGQPGRGGGGGQGGHRPHLPGRTGAGTGPGATGLEEKILDPASWPSPAHLRAQGKKVVFTNGCFDLLHGGHIKFLEDSRRLGDVLVVALDSDDSVRRVKGEGRPVIGEAQRRRILAALEVVDYVTLFDSANCRKSCRTFNPDILTKGSNYPEDQVAGREIVQAYGGQVNCCRSPNRCPSRT